AEPLPVVATFSIIADLTRAVGGERVRVRALVGPDADAHVYQPTPADARLIGRARLVVANGLGFEGWIDRLVAAAGYRGEVLVASDGIEVLHADEHGKAARHHGTDADPHAWQDLRNVKRYVMNIAAALSRADPSGASRYRANAAAYAARLDALEAEFRTAIGRLPPQRRRVVTSHDAFGYLARAYGLRFEAPVGVSTDAEASAADVAALIRQIRREGIPAVFLENISDARLLERVRAETGARIGGTLYSDALSGPGGPAANYLDMMRHNLNTLTAALAP
ncbi:MAG: zinc ABC transporter substrate-binding protein, partial [Candidatus Methylophosphatis roskildensis]